MRGQEDCTNPVSGIGSEHISKGYINLMVYFMGLQAIGEVHIEAHLIDGLKEQLFIGTDVMGPEACQATTEACDNVVFPIVLYAM